MAATAGSATGTPRPGWVAFSDEESQTGMYNTNSLMKAILTYFQTYARFFLYPGKTEHLLYSCSWETVALTTSRSWVQFPGNKIYTG